jgi:hypothetical protein
MTMHTIAAPTAPVNRAYYAHLYTDAGVLTKLDGIIYFLSDTDALTEIQPDHINFLCVLGEVGLADCQQIMDRMHGGAAAIACRR